MALGQSHPACKQNANPASTGVRALGRPRIGESRDDSARPAFREINYTGSELAEMYDYPSAMAVLIDALEKKGVRFDEASFKNQNISHLNKHVVILRGDALKLCDCLFECNPSSVTTHHIPKDMGLLLGSADSSRRTDGNIPSRGDVVFHNRSLPNVLNPASPVAKGQVA